MTPWRFSGCAPGFVSTPIKSSGISHIVALVSALTLAWSFSMHFLTQSVAAEALTSKRRKTVWRRIGYSLIRSRQY
jgi:hypothetical protein